MSSVSGRLCLKLRVKLSPRKSQTVRGRFDSCMKAAQSRPLWVVSLQRYHLFRQASFFGWNKAASVSAALLKTRPLLLWANRKPQSATPGFLFSAGQQVPLSVSMEILVSGCHRLLPWKLRSVGVAHCCHGNTGQWVFSCLETGSGASCCFCVLWENQAAVTDSCLLLLKRLVSAFPHFLLALALGGSY